PNWNWNSFRPSHCGQRRFAATARVHSDWQHGEYRLTHTRPHEGGRQTFARHGSRARTLSRFVRVRGTAAAGSPRDRGARDDFRGDAAYGSKSQIPGTKCQIKGENTNQKKEEKPQPPELVT